MTKLKGEPKGKRPPFQRGDIAIMSGATARSYSWYRCMVRVTSCTPSAQTNSGWRVNFEELSNARGLSIGHKSKNWCSGWLERVLPALGARRAATKERVPAKQNGAKRTPKRTGASRATPKPPRNSTSR